MQGHLSHEAFWTFPCHQQWFLHLCSYGNFSHVCHGTYFMMLVKSCDLWHRLEGFILCCSLWIDNWPLSPAVLCKEVWRSHITLSWCDGRTDTMSFLELGSIFFSWRTGSWEREDTRTGYLLERIEMDLGSSSCGCEEYPGEDIDTLFNCEQTLAG